MAYSQNLEEYAIVGYFENKPIGKFVDIGAYDPEKFSNTRALYLAGWSGVLVEPAPKNYKRIADYYAGDERIQVLNFAVGEPAGEIDFWDCNGDAISTSDEAHRDKWAAVGIGYTKIKVEQVGVVDFMDKYVKDCDFLSIDTESTNMAIFRNIPNYIFEQIKMLCIEHDRCQKEIEERLKPFGFNNLYQNAENIILAKW